MLQIYGITGEKFFGKDTFSDFVKMHNNNFVIMHFADKLREIVSEVYDISQEVMLDPKTKEAPFVRPIQVDSGLEHLKDLTGLKLEPKGMVAHCPRELLKYVGTDYVRSIRDSYWRDIVVNEIRNNDFDKVLVSDTRFLNEAQVLRDTFNARIIRIVRLDAIQSKDNHISELECRLIKEDLAVKVTTGEAGLKKSEQIAHRIAFNDWEGALSFSNIGIDIV